jgi:hypothetical protein
LEEKYENKDEDEDEDSDDEEEEEEYTEEDCLTAFTKEADKHGLSRVERENGIATAKSLFAQKLNPEQLTEKVNADIVRIVRENAELKGQVEHLKLGGYYCHTRPAPNAEINTDDAAFDHYWSVQDKDLTLWKVPRHLADVASAQTSYHGAVEQAFYDECFGEEYGKLKWMRVREMTQADLIKGGWQPKEENENYAPCDECQRFCFTGGAKYPDGFVCADCDEDEEDSEDDDYEDKMAGKLNCRRCGEAKAWSYVFDGGECLNYCSPCLAELEDKKYIVKAEENQNGIQYRFIEQ